MIKINTCCGKPMRMSIIYGILFIIRHTSTSADKNRKIIIFNILLNKQ